MLAPFATLVFLRLLWLAVVVVGRMLARIAARASQRPWRRDAASAANVAGYSVAAQLALGSQRRQPLRAQPQLRAAA